jgi:2-aminoethylphosphonate-pyruvate transaminase
MARNYIMRRRTKERKVLDARKKVCLLNPGPVTITAAVRQSLLCQDLCHREPEFAELLQDVRQRLARVYPAAEKDYTAVLLTGSGTAAVEAMVGSLVPGDGKALVVANGIYGERIATMLQVQGKTFELVRAPWTEPMRLAAAEQALAAGGFTHAIAVHHETTTGRLNDVAGLGRICRRYNVSLLLDAVSSFGGEFLDFADGQIEACAATANKCLHGVPGISFVLAQESVFASRQSAATSLYLDLFRQRAEQLKGYTPFTPAVQVLYALRTALEEMQADGGWEARHRLYQARSQRVRTGLRQLGIGLLLEDDACLAATLTAFRLPPGMPFRELYLRLKRSGFVIYPGQQSLEAAIFRIAVMGDLAEEDLAKFLEAMTAILV